MSLLVRLSSKFDNSKLTEKKKLAALQPARYLDATPKPSKKIQMHRVDHHVLTELKDIVFDFTHLPEEIQKSKLKLHAIKIGTLRGQFNKK